MIDLKEIRKDPKTFDEKLKRRGLPAQSADILNLDKQHRTTLEALQTLQESRNGLAKEIAYAQKEGHDVSALHTKGSAIRTKISQLEEEANSLKAELDQILSQVPNPVLASIPHGTCDAQNKEVRRYLEPKPFSFTPKQHFELGEALGLMDFTQAAKISGSRFVILKGALAQLERALAQFMLDTHIRNWGYEEVSPPYLVNSAALYGTGQLPKFGEDSFETTSGKWLIPTAEVPLTNLGAGQIFPLEALPKRFTAYTPSFRSEAGAAGKDTRGMIRLHQFHKVELVSFTTLEAGETELERMTNAAESILQKLDIPYRVMELCDGDIGFQSQKTYDIEVWLPGQDTYREISSCSLCGDFQARRMNAKYRDESTKKNHFIHTLNGSALAVGRTLVAVLENCQQEDGSIKIPTALQPYMGGKTLIQKEPQ